MGGATDTASDTVPSAGAGYRSPVAQRYRAEDSQQYAADEPASAAQQEDKSEPVAYGMRPGERYGATYGSSVARQHGSAAVSDRRWSNVPVASTESQLPPREQPEVTPPRPRDTVPSDFESLAGRTGGGSDPLGESLHPDGMYPGGMADSEPSAPEESRFRQVVRKIWPFGRGSESEVAPEQPAAEVAERPAPPPSEAESNGSESGLEAEPAPGRKRWYRRLW